MLITSISNNQQSFGHVKRVYLSKDLQNLEISQYKYLCGLTRTPDFLTLGGKSELYVGISNVSQELAKIWGEETPCILVKVKEFNKKPLLKRLFGKRNKHDFPPYLYGSKAGKLKDLVSMTKNAIIDHRAKNEAAKLGNNISEIVKDFYKRKSETEYYPFLDLL